MSLQFAAYPALESAAGIDEAEFIGGFDNCFGDEDFESLGVNPHQATEAKPGSVDKVMMLAARYAAGLPLWHDEDCYDHGPEIDPDLEEM